MSRSRPTHPRKGRERKGTGMEGMSIQDQVDNLAVGVRACGAIGIGSLR